MLWENTARKPFCYACALCFIFLPFDNSETAPLNKLIFSGALNFIPKKYKLPLS